MQRKTVVERCMVAIVQGRQEGHWFYIQASSVCDFKGQNLVFM